MTADQEMRQAFEAWARAHRLRLQTHRGVYVAETTRTCWELWQHLRGRDRLVAL